MKRNLYFAEGPVEGVGESTPIRPGRSRTRSKEKVDEKAKTAPNDKKNAPTRKAPSRGRYVDEYAQPPGL